jgi:mono/diheme cytochrome c family protein
MRRAGNLRRALVAPFAVAAATVFTVALLTAGCAAGGDAPAQTHGDLTRKLFRQNCAACHGQQGEGRQLGTLKVPALREGQPVTDTDARLLAQIHDGGKGMPPFKYTLTDEQMQDLLRFVREELQGRAERQQ